MVRRAWPLALVLLAAAVGCPSPESALPIVSDNPFGGRPSPDFLKAFHAPAVEAVALRVHGLGQKILENNPDLPVRPVFQAVGSPQPEVFHIDHGDTQVIYVSEGLVNRCANDGQLTAVLAMELGKVISQREAQAALKARRPDRDPPISMPVGGDSGGAFGSADAVRLAELGKYDEGRRPVASPPPPPPDPRALGRVYLTRTGYSSDELEAVAPLLREAEGNSTVEKTMTGTAVRPWVRE
jgi:hypothetical protein